jgi:hypothetical protein
VAWAAWVVSSPVIPDDEDLVMHVAPLQICGEEAARQDSPDISARIALCPLCRAENTSIREVLADEPPIAAEQQSLWDRPSAWERRITSALVHPKSEPPRGISDPLSGERFTVALRDDTAGVPVEWVNLAVKTHTLFAQRITGQIRAIRAPEGMSTIPADGVPWRLESVDASEEGAHAHSGTRNTTDSAGAAPFSITGVGIYEIIITTAGLYWIVPLAIRADTQGDQ